MKRPCIIIVPLFIEKLFVIPVIHIFQEIPGLAFQYPTDLFQSGKAYGFGFTAF
jgi:hypothetical protein